MGDGLFFWLIIVAVAVLQGIGQKKKKTGKPGQRLPGSKPQGQQAPTRTRPSQTGSGTDGVDVSSDEGTSSEAVIPSDVWEEILGLARGAPPKGGRVQRAPPEEMEETLPPEIEEREPWEMETRRAPSPPVAPMPDSAPAAREFPASHGANAVLHATRPSESESRSGVRRQSEYREEKSSEASVRAELFGGGTLRELRKAIVHQEVLGKPVTLREDS